MVVSLEQIRNNFPIVKNFNFMNHAAVAPLSGPAAEAMVGYARELSESAYLGGNFYRTVERVRQQSAKLINADTSEVTFVRNTSMGINLVANGISWATGDNVVSNTMEFPGNVYPWLALEPRGVALKRVREEDGRIPFDQLAAAIDRRTRLVSISAVQWSNGFRTDLVRLGELCKSKGVLLFVDAIQALGVHPIDVRAMNIDFLSCGGHKWLVSPEGVGIFYCRRELICHLRPFSIGYMSVKQDYEQEARDFRLDDLREDARRFDNGVYNVAGICALGASLDLLLGIGIDQVQIRVKQLTDMLCEGVRSKGWTLHSPRTASEWSGIVSFSSDRHDTEALRKHLRSEFKVIVANRLGRLRASPHFYISLDDMKTLIDALPAH